MSDEAVNIDVGDLGFLNNCRWRVCNRAGVAEIARPCLMNKPDEALIEIFYDCFVADFKLEKVESNRFRLEWGEYKACDLGKPWYKGLVPGVYTGEELIEFMLNGFETPAHLCSMFNKVMRTHFQLPYKFIMPWNGRDEFLMCEYYK